MKASKSILAQAAPNWNLKNHSEPESLAIALPSESAEAIKATLLKVLKSGDIRAASQDEAEQLYALARSINKTASIKVRLGKSDATLKISSKGINISGQHGIVGQIYSAMPYQIEQGGLLRARVAEKSLEFGWPIRLATFYT